MLNAFQWFSVACILAVTFAGGYVPLRWPGRARTPSGLPLGQAFATGVFLALSLIIMLPNAMGLFRQALPGVHYPLASLLALGMFVGLVLLGHVVKPPGGSGDPGSQEAALSSPVAPVVMLVMIAIPSFLLGTALGVSETLQAVLIFLAIMAHKGSAGFALALAMTRSRLPHAWVVTLYALFALATPAGIVAGQEVRVALSGEAAAALKACILSVAAGTFLFMGTLHEFRHQPLVIDCCRPAGFALMLVGLLLTAGIRLLLDLAHHTW